MMIFSHRIAGTMLQYDQPDWTPLVDLLGDELAEWFMWMHEVELADGRRLHAFKHVDTRRYLHLTHDLRAFAFVDDDVGGYVRVHLPSALDTALAGWERSTWPPDDPVPPRSAVATARRRAHAAALAIAEAGVACPWRSRRPRLEVATDVHTLSSAKARLSELVDRVARRHDRVVVTRDGKPAAVLIGTGDLESVEETVAVLSDPALRARIEDADAEPAGDG